MATLAEPKPDQASARQRGHSAVVRTLATLKSSSTAKLLRIDFKSATTGVAAKTMRNELNRMVANVQDPAKKKASQKITLSHFDSFTCRFL
nr:hypothetical protein L203_03453 [Cryptococcus depauperatus CBS 7841]